MNNGNVPRGAALSPVSVAGSEWSGISRYQSVQSNGSDGYYNNNSPNGGGGGGGGPNGGGMMNGQGNMGGMGGMGGMGPPSRQNTYDRNNGPPPQKGPYSNMLGSQRDDDRGPSPPSSIARSSDGAGLYSDSGYSSLKGIVVEEELAIHHAALKRLLVQDLINDRNPKQKRARDKLLRLSTIQFQELSTDVYDELQRRQAVSERRNTEQTLNYLPPKELFHPKRNQARMKLSTLPVPRFRDLAKDVFYELERRYPQFNSDDIPLSPTGSLSSMRGFPQPPGRMGSPGPGRMGSPGPGRMGSPGPGRMGSPGPNGPNGPNGMRNGPPPQGYPPNQGPPGPGGPGGPNQFGRPLPKTFQSNTIIPNKSTMVEEDDDGMDDDPDQIYGSDGYVQEGRDRLPGMTGPSGNSEGGAPMRRESSSSRVRSRAGSMKSVNGINISGVMGSPTSNEKLIADYQSQVTSLQQRLEDLEITLREKEAEAIRLKDDDMQRESAALQERKDWEEDKYELEAKIASLETQNQQLQEDIERYRSDYEAKENSLLDQIDSCNQQIDDMNNRLAEQEDELLKAKNSKPSGKTTNSMAYSGDYAALLQEHAKLKDELKEQQEVTEEVQREATEFLREMKSLSERSAESWEREEKLSQQLHKLQDEVKEWKGRYARVKTQLRTIRAASMGLALQQSVSLGARDGGHTDPNGLIKDVHVTRFQIAIDDLLRTARSVDPAVVLDYMKSVVVATRAITHEVDEATSSNRGLANADAILKLKSRVSATANNLITAAKNHATANGLSPVSLLDAAASHLTASVVELVKVVKLRPTPPGEMEEAMEEMIDQENAPGQLSRQFSVASTTSTQATQSRQQQQQEQQQQTFSPERQRMGTPDKQQQTATPDRQRIGTPVGRQQGPPRSSQDSVYSSTSSPAGSIRHSKPVGGGGWGKREGLSMMSPPRDLPKGPMGGQRPVENDVEQLRVFVETQFEGIVESISTLLDAIRKDKAMDILRDEIYEIGSVVGKVVDSTQSSMSVTSNVMLREKGEWIVKKLADCRGKMMDMGDQGARLQGGATKEFKGKLAGLAYDMAREIKELVKTVEDIDNEGRQDSGLDAAVQEYMMGGGDDLR
ncbi:hypothetical protein DFH27DRAFT_221162 [Peziza echinospora]|nr:hypothetical protein DFH27DRAFT_221162 [Peziza echinospora]